MNDELLLLSVTTIKSDTNSKAVLKMKPVPTYQVKPAVKPTVKPAVKSTKPTLKTAPVQKTVIPNTVIPSIFVVRPGGFKATDHDAAFVADKIDSVSDESEMDQLKLQLSMDRLEKTQGVVSNLLKKISDTNDQLVQNLK
ncbi:hypothetical protein YASMINEVIRUS_137 [Yasminevirus sp. GU-2018]|uniref:Uncharacterized protein n=1 Tax=Yasminevirus sp. GU-2018 TaxID=2420051 RepID=A0A5K0U848_9VIRU|nr:hypothetical protein YASMINEVIRUS_137 [Yasminevirus sp. GU-2018]